MLQGGAKRIVIIDSDVKIAVTCEKCGRINVEQLNLFKLNKKKETRLSCSCGSLNCIIYSSDIMNINLLVSCVDCGEDHVYKYKLKEFLTGDGIICPEMGTVISIIGDRKDISRYIRNAEKDTLEVLYDEKFELFFNNHNIVKESLEKLQTLKERNMVSCDCGNEDIATEIYSDRIELRCTRCQSIKVIYAETQEDLKNFNEKSSINMRKCEFEFIDAIKNSDNK